MGRATVDVSPRAQQQIRSARKWWFANRDKAPFAFDEDLDEMIELLEISPMMGTLILSKRTPNLRRVLLERSNHHLYYRTVDDDRLVEVLCLWYAGRADRPSL